MSGLKKREPAFTNCRQLLRTAVAQKTSFEMRRINHGEVIYSICKFPDIRGSDHALQLFASLPIRLHSIDDALVDKAVQLKSRYAFSFTDAFAAALPIRLDADLVTGDKEFRSREVDGLLKVRWVGA